MINDYILDRAMRYAEEEAKGESRLIIKAIAAAYIKGAEDVVYLLDTTNKTLNNKQDCIDFISGVDF